MKTFKKVLASTLAAAMVVTAFPVTNAEAASTAKLSATKATVYVGGSKTLSVKTPSNWKNVKVKATSSKKSIAKISKVSGKKVTVKAVKKGTAKVTVKVTAKKAGKKVSKTLKATVTVKNPTITLNQTKATLNVGETTPVKVTKKTPSSITVKYSSEDPAIASVSKGTITAISAGTTNIVVTAQYGSKTFTKKVAVTVKAVKDGLTTALTNQLSATDYPDTVLVSDPAIINVTYTKGGKPVTGQTLVISRNNDALGTGADSDYYFENTSATTNASGVATFVVKNRYSNINMSDVDEVASVNYRIQLADTTAETGTNAVTGTVNFASVSVKNVDVKTDTKTLAPGTNFPNNTSAIKKRNYVTNTNQGTKYSEYVLSQQVSTAGTEEHAVTFNGGYPVITLPGTTTDATTTKGSQEINYTSGAYKTYATNKQTFKLDKEPKELSYATLNFKDVSISKYTALEIYAYDNENSAAKDITADAFDTKVYDGEMTEGKFGYQIPLSNANANAAGVWIVVKIVSKGQVQDGKNNGYTATNIDFVYKNPQGTKGKEELYKNGQVTWKQVDTPYTAEQKFTTNAEINGASLYDGSNTEALDAGKYNYSVKLPVFPYTGDAVITKTDKNGKVAGYYAVATVNNGKNQNVIERNATAYQISADEVKETTGTITQKDNALTVNAEKAGRMTLEGVVTINGKEIAEADLAHVYTSVQWNPVPKASTTAKNYVALLGQKIEVIGQLVDKNGNAVSTSGETVDFYAGNTKLASSTTLTNAPYGKASVVSIKNTTDTQGQAKVTLKASDITTVQNLTAKVNSSKYDVVLKIVKDETVEIADLYWVDADLAFQDKVNTTDNAAPVKVTTDTVHNDVKTSDKNADTKPEVGTSWFYGVYTEGTYYDVVARTTKEVSINGIDAAISKSVESVGSMESLGEGVAKVTSTKAGDMNLVSKIDATTGTTKATVAKDGFTFAGTGAPSISKKLTINVVWQTQGVTASYIVPTGTRVATNGAFNVYVKVQDNLGNPIKDQKVYFSVDNGSATIGANATTGVFALTTDADGKFVKTTADGIASVALTPQTAAVAGQTITVTAKVGDDTFDQTFRWIDSNEETAPTLNKNKNAETGKFLTYFDRNAKTVSIVFDKDIVTESVIKELFKVYIGAAGANTDTQYKVTNAVANGNVVTLTLADVPSTITANDKVFVEISTNILDSAKVAHTLTATNGMVATIASVTIDANNENEPQ